MSSEGLQGSTVARRARLNAVRSVALRNWWVLTLFMLLGFICGVFFSVMQRPLYSATATLYVTPNYGAGSEATNVYQDELAAQQRAVSYARLISSKSIAAAAVSASDGAFSVEEYTSAVSSSVTPDTTLLSVSAKSGDALKSRDIANAGANALSEYIESLDGGSSDRSITKLAVVTPAAVEGRPVSPVVRRNLLFGGFIGLLVGCLFLVAKVRFDDRIHRGTQAAELASAPLLASIPLDEVLQTDPIVNFAHGGFLVESYRRLFVNLRFIDLDKSGMTVLITSPKPGDGKSSVALNLGRAIAEAGHSVVVVDADLRRPSLASRVGLSPDIGLSSVLAGDGSVLDFVQRSDSDSVHVLASGVLPPSPSRVLGSSRMRSCISDLADRFEYVIVDSPPVLAVSDASVLAQYADATLVVVGGDSTSVPELVNCVRELTQSGRDVSGVVYNKDSLAPSSSSYYSGLNYRPDTSVL